MKPKWLSWHLVPCPDYALCLTDAQFRAKLKELGVTDDLVFTSKDASTHTFEKGRDVTCIVTLRDNPEFSGIQVAAILVHEAVHVWQTVRSMMGEEAPSSEFEAYSIQSIAQGLMGEYARLKGLK